MTTYVHDKDIPLLLSISASPEDCLLNHKVSKVALKRLITSCLIEVETRRIEPWCRSGLNYNLVRISNGGDVLVSGFKSLAQPAVWRKATPDETAEAKRVVAEHDTDDKRWNKLRTWLSRTEIHAKLTEDGYAWFAEFRRPENQVLYEA